MCKHPCKEAFVYKLVTSACKHRFLAVLKARLKTFSIKTHDSESRGQEKAAIIRKTKITRPLSELFTRKTANKIANALVKLP